MSYIEPPIDSDPNTLIADILDSLMAAFSGWTPQEGHLATALAEAVGRQNAETRDLASRFPTAAFRYLGRTLLDISPVDAAAATALTTWTATNTAGYTIKAGTQVGYKVAGDKVIPFRVVSDIVIPPGMSATTAGQVEIAAVTPGTAGNDLTSGTLVLIDSLSWVATIAAVGDTAGGVNAETDSSYLGRLREQLTLLAPRPILAPDFAIMARSVSGVYRALGIDNYWPGRAITAGITSGSPTMTSAALFTADDVGRTVAGIGITGGTTITAYTDASQVTLSANATATNAAAAITLGALTNAARAVAIAAVDAEGVAVSSGVKTALATFLDGKREVNFAVHVIDPTYTTINVAFTFTTRTGYDSAVVNTLAEAGVASFLSPATWNGGNRTPPLWTSDETKVRMFELAALLYAVQGLQDVTALTINGGTVDVTLSGVAPLPQVGTVVGTPA